MTNAVIVEAPRQRASCTDLEPEPERKYVDTKTRFQAIYARHRLSCALASGGKRCTCSPSYWGKVWDPAIGRHRKTKHRRLIGEAKNLRDDLLARVRGGTVEDPPAGPDVTFEEAHTEFIRDCREGVALNKRGKPYKRKAITDLDSSLRSFPEYIRKKSFRLVTTGDLQRTVDGLIRRKLSSSRINSIVNASRSLYRWGEEREKVKKSPANEIRLPANDSRERDRVATPGEFAHLLDQLEDADALPWALAGYGTARHQEIQALEWPEVDFDHDVILLADDEEARKSDAARRLVPMVRPLRRRLYREWVKQGRPKEGKVCPPRKKSTSGQLSLNWLLKFVTKLWRGFGLEPITHQDSRHTAATWLDHAGVPPKVSSEFMGHKAPRRHLHPDAAPITLRRYTHVLEGELQRAARQLDLFLAHREEAEQNRH
jgi:integrase